MQKKDIIKGISDLQVDCWAREIKTPAYIVDMDSIGERCELIKSSFADHLDDVGMLFPFKTNCLPPIVSKVLDAGFGAEVASNIELRLARELRAKPIFFNGPGKTVDELVSCADNGATIVFDSFSELETCNEIRKDLEGASFALRVCPNTLLSRQWSRFGVPLDHLGKFLKKAEAYGFHLEGLSFHIGSHIREKNLYPRALDELARKIKSQRIKELVSDHSFFDCGGGFASEGVRHKGTSDFLRGQIDKRLDVGFARNIRRKRDIPSIEDYAKSICGGFEDSIAPFMEDARLFIEPGTWIVQNCCHLLTSVLYEKPDGIICDLGINNIPDVQFFDYPIMNVTRGSESPVNIYVFGPLCRSDDLIGDRVFGKSPKRGDILCIKNVGAYNMSWSQQFIKPLAKVCSITNARLDIVRDEEDFEYRFARDRV